MILKMRKIVFVLIILLSAVFVSSLAPPNIREVYTPEPVVYVVFDDPTNVSVTSYALVRGFVDFFSQTNTSNSSNLNFVALNPPVKTDNTFVFEPVERLEEGNFTFKITAEDIFGNSGTFYSKFTIVELPFNVSMVDPSNGVASSSTFPVTIDTFVNASCKYNNVDTSFDNSYDFSDNNNIHSISSYQLLNENVEYPFYVKCKNQYNDIAARMFLISYDTSPPIINSLTAPDTWNNKVVEPIRTATLEVITDEDARCEYSENGASFERFSDNFSTTNTRKFTGLADFSTHTFDVKCMNKAELWSEEERIEIEVNTGLGLGIDVQSPEPFMSSLAIPFIISTSKSASCSLASGNNNFSIPLSSSDGTSHTYTTSVVAGGSYSYQVGCSYLKVTVNETGYSFATEDIDFVVDITPPVITNVTDEGITASLDSLSATINAADPESGIESYYFAIGSSAFSTDIKDWTKATSSIVSASNLNLTNGLTYYFTAIAENGAGMNSTESVSKGVKVDTLYTPTTTTDNETAEVSRAGCIVDDDRDGYGLGCVSGYDCDDTNPAGNLANCGNGCIQDSDGDSYGVGCFDGRDCNDLDSTVSFGCTNKCRIDTDGDGYGPGCLNGPDCDDYSSDSIGSCTTGIGCSNDNDCDGIDDSWENENSLDSGFDDSAADPDNDGISNLDEYRANSDPTSAGSSSSVQKPQVPKRQEEPEPEGFDWMLIIIIVIILLLVGLGGSYVYSNFISKKPKGKAAYPAASRVQQRATPGFAPTARPRTPGLTPEQRRQIAARKTRDLERVRKSKERSSLFDVFSTSKPKEEPKPAGKSKISPVGSRVLRKARKAPVRKETPEFKGLSDFVNRKSVFNKLGSLRKEEKDVFKKIKSLDERHLDKLDTLIKDKKISDKQVFDSLTAVGSKKAERNEFVDKLDKLINTKKKSKR